MLDYLIALLDDSNDFSWSAAKASHAVLLCRMEQSEISDYTQTDLVDRVRRAQAQRHIVLTTLNSSQMSESQKLQRPCLVIFTIKVRATILLLMNSKVSCISIYVLSVSQKGEKFCTC